MEKMYFITWTHMDTHSDMSELETSRNCAAQSQTPVLDDSAPLWT